MSRRTQETLGGSLFCLEIEDSSGVSLCFTNQRGSVRCFFARLGSLSLSDSLFHMISKNFLAVIDAAIDSAMDSVVLGLYDLPSMACSSQLLSALCHPGRCRCLGFAICTLISAFAWTYRLGMNRHLNLGCDHAQIL